MASYLYKVKKIPFTYLQYLKNTLLLPINKPILITTLSHIYKPSRHQTENSLSMATKTSA